MPSFLVPLYEFNTCHAPAGTPVGGRFCSDPDAFVPMSRQQTRVPRTYADAADILAMGWFSEKTRQDINDPALKGNVYWQDRLRQEREEGVAQAAKNWTKVLKTHHDPAKVRPQVLAAVEQGMADNAANTRFMRIVGRFGSDGVIAVPGSDDPAAHWDSNAAARRVGAVTVVMDTFWFDRTFAARRNVPEPGQATIESSGGMAGVLRHEYGHHIWNRLRVSDREHFRELIVSFRSEAEADRGGGRRYDGLKDKLTLYSADRDEEAFTESFAVWSDPRFDRTRFPADVQPLFDWLERRFAGPTIERA